MNDCELEKIIHASRDAGADTANYALLRLPLELGCLFETWLRQHYPGRAQYVLNLVRETRAGAPNDSRFGHRFRGHGVYADLLGQCFTGAARRLGMAERAPLATVRFAPPSPAGASAVGCSDATQLVLF